jgi:DNA invertase Pin-like site-specific DNA recombinase
MLVGYMRAASDGAFPAAEDAVLRSVGCEVVFADQGVSSAAEPLPELTRAVDSLQPHDVLLVTGLDRLGSGLRELITRMVQVQAKGASVRTVQGAVDTHIANGKELLEALLSFDRKLADASSKKDGKAARQLDQDDDRPRLLDVAAERLKSPCAPQTRPQTRSLSRGARRKRVESPSA